MANIKTGKVGKSGHRVVTEKSAGAVVFIAAKPVEFLLLRAKHWEFPKGLIEAKESEQGGAVREVREETGLDVALVPHFRESIDYFYRRQDGTLVKKQVVYFLGHAKTRAFKISWEHQEAQWMTLEQAMGILEYENSRALLQKANKRIWQLEL